MLGILRSWDVRFMAETYKITLDGNGVHLEQEVSKDIALGVISLVMGGGNQYVGADNVLEEQQHQCPAISLPEFLINLKVATIPERITAIGQFLMKERGQNSFTKDNIKTSFAEAKEPMPKNFSRDFANAIRSGWVNEVHGAPGTYYVTNTGLKATMKD